MKWAEGNGGQIVRLMTGMISVTLLFLYGHVEWYHTLGEYRVGLLVLLFNLLGLMSLTVGQGRRSWICGTGAMASVAGVAFWMTCHYGASCYAVSSPLYLTVLVFLHLVGIFVVVPILFFSVFFVISTNGIYLIERVTRK